MSGATFPDCGAAAVEAAAAAAPPTQASANDNKLPVSIVWGLNERVTKDADGVAHFSFAENSEAWFDVAQPAAAEQQQEVPHFQGIPRGPAHGANGAPGPRLDGIHEALRL